MTGKDLKLGREQKGWTQEEAATRLSVSQPYLSLIEKGARPLSKKLARKAASAFGLSATTCRSKQAGRPCNPRMRTLSPGSLQL
jgi:transcriptional regulator with XRE-family HTH domain